MGNKLRRLGAVALLLAMLLPLALPEALAEAQAPEIADEMADAFPAEEIADELPAQEAPAENPAAEVPADEADMPSMSALPEGFELLKPAPANINKYYTGILIDGFEKPVYAFTDKEGATQFRVYGRLSKRKGWFKAEVRLSADGLPQVSVAGEKPIKDGASAFSNGKPVKFEDSELPEGYKRTTKPGVITFTNLFKQKEYRVLGEIPGIANAWYPAVNGRPRAGSLAIDIEMDRERFRQEGSKYYRLPREYRKGVGMQVFIFTTDGQRITVWTDKPKLDREKLS